MKPGSFDPPELYSQLLGELSGDTCWDIGTSVGNVTTQLVGRFKNVVGFEPSIIALDYLKTIPTVGGVKISDLAISDHDGFVDLDLEEGRRRVACRTLDSLTTQLGEPDFIKVDVEGHEVEVLEGSVFLMITKGPEWLIETYSKENGKKCRAILNSYGYDMKIIKDPNEQFPAQHHWIRAKIRQ